MQKTFQVLNVKCSGCARTLKERFFEKFGEVEVDLTKVPREITLNIEEEQIEEFSTALKKLGYPLSSDTMGFVESTSVKAKSFVSCAIGKMNQ